MLVLSRKSSQEIMIGKNVKVTVLQIKGNTVRLGIEAPREVRVVRGELPPKDEPISEVHEFTLKFKVGDSADEHESDGIVPFRTSTSKKQAPSPSDHRMIGNRLDLVANDSQEPSGMEATRHRVRDILALLTRQPH